MKLNSYQIKALRLFAEQRITMLAREAAKGSTGYIGKFAEGVRIALNSKPTDVLRTRAANRADLRKGATIIEVKTGSGAVAYAENFEKGYICKEDCVAENVLKSCHYVLWYPFHVISLEEMASATTPEKALALLERFLENAWVFTRQEFINCLEAIGKNGLQSSLKISKNGGQMNIQTITPRMEGRLWDVLENQQTGMEMWG